MNKSKTQKCIPQSHVIGILLLSGIFASGIGIGIAELLYWLGI